MDGADSKTDDKTKRDVLVCLASSEFRYRFDLLPIETVGGGGGHSQPTASLKQLIYTKTSERCFLAASQAVGRLKLGASPYGPAGSGKTETIKALGALLGCQVIVHNCDETNDTESLERLVWGLAHTGLWGCFDEFNRLGSGTLSSVSGLLELVQASLRCGRFTLELADGHMKSIDPDSAFFVTLNPAGDGLRYRGRRRLPANLRALFLSIAMVRTQMEPIIREMLLVFGATSGRLQLNASLASELALNLANWVECARASLHTERCAWDLRLVMTIVRRFKAALLEARTCAKALRSTLIESIVKEVGPRLSEDAGEFELLAGSLKQAFEDDRSQIDAIARPRDNTNNDTNPTRQLEEQLETRPGVILLGPSGAGKSLLWRSLLDELNAGAAKPVVSYFRLSPKSCSKSELFGSFGRPDEDVDLGAGSAPAAASSSQVRTCATAGGQRRAAVSSWSDGLFTKLVRDSLRQLEASQSLQQVWLVLDGALDPDWI